MSTVKKFEDLECWKKSRDLCNKIFLLAQNSPFCNDYSLKDQILRSSGSVMDNIAEGYERGGNREIIQYLYIAKSSCGEVRSQLHRALDRSYLKQLEFDELYSLAEEISRIIYGFINYLKNSEIKGQKFK